MQTLFQIRYIKKHDESNPIVKHIKASSRIEAIMTGMPTNEIGEEEIIDNIEIHKLCDSDEILECTSAQGK
jgi:hypothetical protein